MSDLEGTQRLMARVQLDSLAKAERLRTLALGCVVAHERGIGEIMATHRLAKYVKTLPPFRDPKVTKRLTKMLASTQGRR